MNTMRNTPHKRQNEPTCASCDCCSVHGQYCHLWNMTTELHYGCAQHSKIKPAARR